MVIEFGVKLNILEWWSLCHFMCIAMSNQELVDAGTKRMDETDQAIERSKQVSYKMKKCVPLTSCYYRSDNILVLIRL